VRPRVITRLLHGVLLLSGAAGLGCQMVWTRMFSLGLGHEMPAVLAVVAAFFGGLALGACALDGRVSRSARPGRWYAALELVAGAWCLLSTVLIPHANSLALAWIGLEPSPPRHWTVAFLVPLLTLLPATTAMGATLAAMERFVHRLAEAPAPVGPSKTGVRTKPGMLRCVGSLYAANTLGAMGGTLFSTFQLLPAAGFTRSLVVLGLVNLVCGLVAWWLEGQAQHALVPLAPGAESGGAGPRAPGIRPGLSPRTTPQTVALGLVLFLTGLLGIGYEVVGVRMLSLVCENTVYTFAAALAAYLLGTAAGAGLGARCARRLDLHTVVSWCLCGLAIACLAGAWTLQWSPGLYGRCRGACGDSLPGVLAAEGVVAAAVFGPPTILMGAVFSSLAELARSDRGGIGWALGLNTLGGAVAPLAFGVILFPASGAKWALVIVGAGYLCSLATFSLTRARLSPAAPSGAAGPSVASPSRPTQAWLGWTGLAAAAVLVATLPPRLELTRLAPGDRVRDSRDGIMDSVAVIETPTGDRTLRVNNRFTMGGTASVNAERRHALIPLLLHPAPARGLVLGAGTGITFGAAALEPGLEAHGVELVPEVARMMTHFEPQNLRANWAPRLELFVADARRFVRTTTNRYDAIVADLFHPARDGAGALYTREHFAAIRDRLAPGGLFCQWLPLYQLDTPVLQVIVRTFLDVFPHARAHSLRMNLETPVLGLIGTLAPLRYGPDWFERRVQDPALAQALQPLALADTVQLLGTLVAGPAALEGFAAGARVNTDDHPIVTFAAPRFVYRRQADSFGRLFSLLAWHGADARDLVGDAPGAGEFAQRLTRYFNARDVYLHGLLAEKEGRRAAAEDAFVKSAQLSVDFSTGYAHVLTLATQRAKAEPAAARALLDRLIEAQPGRPVARELRQRLFEP